jgi:hypothetical protein
MSCVGADGKPLLFSNEAPRATTGDPSEAGWVVDRAAGKKFGFYGMADDGTGSDLLTLGSRTDDSAATDAKMNDTIRITRKAGESGGCTARTFAIDIEHGDYLGGFAWGYNVGRDGTVTTLDLTAADMGGAQRAVIKGWNTQAGLDDASKKNAADQQTLPAAHAPYGDYNTGAGGLNQAA